MKCHVRSNLIQHTTTDDFKVEDNGIQMFSEPVWFGNNFNLDLLPTSHIYCSKKKNLKNKDEKKYNLSKFFFELLSIYMYIFFILYNRVTLF